MTSERAIKILTPGETRFSPAEYEDALALAREALRYWQTHSMAASIAEEMREKRKP